MSADEIYFWSTRWLIVGAVVVIAAAGLLIAVIVAARRILRLAKAAQTVVAEIEQNTKPIWQLSTSHAVATDLLSGAEAIRGNAGAIVDALGAADGQRAA